MCSSDLLGLGLWIGDREAGAGPADLEARRDLLHARGSVLGCNLGGPGRGQTAGEQSVTFARFHPWAKFHLSREGKE